MPSPQRWALAGAVALAAAWLVWPAPEDGGPATAPGADAVPSVWETWDAAPAEWPGAIDDRAWRPVSFLDDTTALGVDEAGRLLYVESGAVPPTTAPYTAMPSAALSATAPSMAVPSATVLTDPGDAPGVVATAANDSHLAWIESTPDDAGRIVSELWIAERGADGPPGEARLLTADTGDVVLTGSAYDLQFAEAELHWLATARTAQRTTEQRSVGVGGGAVSVVERPGAWRAAAWPWMVGAGSDSLGGAHLVRADDDSAVLVEAGSDELALCSATWCRLITTGADGSRVDLVRPDGTDRVTVAEGFASAVAADVGLLDRFEPLEEPIGQTGDARRVTLFDLAAGKTYLVAPAAGETGADAHRLWWSTGSDERRVWHVLDLTDLA